LAVYSTIEIGDFQFTVTREEVKKLKAILDKLKIHHILDNVCFHDVEPTVELLKAINNVKVWKVEKDGSVSLKNRFGHSGRFKYKKLVLPSIHEFAFADLGTLSKNESEFVGNLIYNVESRSYVS
jgi:hypothetical protein